jgi:hypothetical protein
MVAAIDSQKSTVDGEREFVASLGSIPHRPQRKSAPSAQASQEEINIRKSGGENTRV